MLKNFSQIEAKIADKVYHLTCDADSPIEHLKYALGYFKAFVEEFENKMKPQVQLPVEQPKVEEPKIEEEQPKEEALEVENG